MTAMSRAPARISRAAGRGAASHPYTPPTWTLLALCAQADPEAWFPEKGERSAAAKAICSRCPVRIPCLLDALARNERWGIYGGLSTPERDELRRECAA